MTLLTHFETISQTSLDWATFVDGLPRLPSTPHVNLALLIIRPSSPLCCHLLYSKEISRDLSGIWSPTGTLHWNVNQRKTNKNQIIFLGIVVFFIGFFLLEVHANKPPTFSTLEGKVTPAKALIITSVEEHQSFAVTFPNVRNSSKSRLHQGANQNQGCTSES